MKKLFWHLVFIVPVYILLSFSWHFLVEGVLYYCSDSLPFLNLYPQFVHGTQYGDHFIVSPVFVYLVWVAHMMLLFITPYKLASIVMEKIGKY